MSKNSEPNTPYRKLNLGCGGAFRKDWVNIDIAPSAPEVLPFDLKKGIPFPDRTFNAVYHSHVIEHLSPEDGEKLIRECARVLKPGGILRISAPDLEKIARTYLEKLDAARDGKTGADAEYRWTILELIDQLVRNRSGGKMAHLLAKEDLPELPFIISQVGSEATDLRAQLRAGPTNRGTRRARSVSQTIWSVGTRVRLKLFRLLVFVFGGRAALTALENGTFRTSGEIHLWMYDSFSLTSLLRCVGFREIDIRRAEQSAIEGFAGSGLEVRNGQIRKPDSLFIEAVYSPQFTN